jgi:hypothetical protein
MEFIGRILRVFPQQRGVSQRTGNEWVQQSFVFEYFEDPNQRYSDKVVLQTFDTNVMAQLEENAQVRIGFGMNIREYIKDGKTSVFNEPRMYKFERLDAAEADPQPAPQTEQTAAAPFPPAQPPQIGEKKDDLPF